MPVGEKKLEAIDKVCRVSLASGNRNAGYHYYSVLQFGRIPILQRVKWAPKIICCTLSAANTADRKSVRPRRRWFSNRVLENALAADLNGGANLSLQLKACAAEINLRGGYSRKSRLLAKSFPPERAQARVNLRHTIFSTKVIPTRQAPLRFLLPSLSRSSWDNRATLSFLITFFAEGPPSTLTVRLAQVLERIAGMVADGDQTYRAKTSPGPIMEANTACRALPRLWKDS
jgi:hypothetical protein